MSTNVESGVQPAVALSGNRPEIGPNEIEIEKLVYGGDGLGRLPAEDESRGGEVLFVPWSAPGDVLRIRREPGTKPARGLIEAVLKPSPDRVEPPCTVFGDCGGCQWQHVSLAAQRRWKREMVRESLTRLGKLDNPPVLETLAAAADEAAWHYRNRAQWEVMPDGTLGYNRAQSHDVIDFQDCRIIPEPLNAIAAWLREKLRADQALAGRISRVEAFINRNGDILLTLMPKGAHELNRLAEALKNAFPAVSGVASATGEGHRLQYKTLLGQDFITETLGGRTYQVSAGSFFQTHIAAAEAMLAVLDDWLLPDATSLVDLYAGVGVFAAHFAGRAGMQRVLAIESAPSAVADARKNFQAQAAGETVPPELKSAPERQSGPDLKSGDVARLLPAMQEKFDVAIVDPPRAGCKPEVLHWLGKRIQRQILYVSCNPATLARDLRTLTAAGWRVEAVQPVDMFPQTYHVETLVHLVRQ